MRCYRTVVVVASLLSVAPSLAATGPSLDETIGWMDSTYNPHLDQGGASGHGVQDNQNNGVSFLKRNETLSAKGCEMTLSIHDDPLVAKDVRMDTTTSFDLGDIDPHSIKMLEYDLTSGGLSCREFPGTVCNMAVLEFETRNQLPLMAEKIHLTFPKLTGKDHESDGAKRAFVANIYLDEIDYSKRFERAFRHAISLCGAKPSTF